MKNLRFHIASLILIVTIIVAFTLPKPKYQGTSILQDLNMPFTLGNQWQSVDYTNNLSTTKDDRFNFLSGAFARIYGTQDGKSLLFLILDAGNFHHPQLCYGGSGFKTKELSLTELTTQNKAVKVRTFLAKKDSGETIVVMYWMVINKQKVDWTEQKFAQLWHSLFNKKQVGLMTRLDIPVSENKIDDAVTLGQKFIKDLTKNLSNEKQEWMFGR
ncbi:MAG: exosortase-associated EpsI family protein [Candidatus Omnitrophica bacterium]|nr:exosortase-associated EpsI family protein [Candidatus Omnitrophota bacterium]